MRTYRTTYGPFAERPHYSADSVERICSDELRKAGLFPSEPAAIRIDRFIEKRFKISPTYDDLPEGILGCTKFGPKGVIEIIISRSLAEENSKVSERRINSTLAHEVGHGLLHSHLFVLGQIRNLFGDGLDSNETKILCRKENIEGIQADKKISYGGRWWEYQANMVIGSILLPRQLVKIVLNPFFIEKGRLGAKILDPTHKEKATRELVEIFDVNPIVTRIRINNVFSPSQENQLFL
jgi:hypothetical protein